MCGMSVDLPATIKGCDFDTAAAFAGALDLLRPLAADGNLVIDGCRIEVTEKGRPFVRLVASRLSMPT